MRISNITISESRNKMDPPPPKIDLTITMSSIIKHYLGVLCTSIKNCYYFVALSIVMLLSTPLQAQEVDSYPLDTAIWSDLNIPVCWENASETHFSSASSRALVQNAVQATWESNSQVKFTGWGQCPSSSFDGIRIGASQDLHDEDGAHVKGLGRNIAGMKDGMVLNFLFENWNQSCPKRHGKSKCIEWIAVHEFGHALAFSHEQNRPDTPDSCELGQKNDIFGNAIFTIWDENSIMNYCNPNYNGHGNLSAIDILTVQTYYGRIPSYNDTTKKIIIPVVRVGADSYSATLTDSDGDGRYTLSSFTPTTNLSSKPAVYHASSSTVNFPLVKVTDNRGKVTSLYSAVMERHADGEFTILSHSLIQQNPR